MAVQHVTLASTGIHIINLPRDTFPNQPRWQVIKLIIGQWLKNVSSSFDFCVGSINRTSTTLHYCEDSKLRPIHTTTRPTQSKFSIPGFFGLQNKYYTETCTKTFIKQQK
jgi:hypothetical protein